MTTSKNSNQNRPSTVAIITARGGSKRLPGKNVRPLLGRPMISYSIRAALDCELVDRLIVSTDDPEIKRVSENEGAEVFDRPAEYATDSATSEIVVQHVLEALQKAGENYDRVVLLQPTSPLRTASQLRECLMRMEEKGAVSSLSVTEPHLHPAKFFQIKEDGWMQPFLGPGPYKLSKSELPVVARPNGAIYAVRTDVFRATGTFFAEPALPYLMSAEDSVDIDTLDDFNVCEAIMKRRQGMP